MASGGSAGAPADFSPGLVKVPELVRDRRAFEARLTLVPGGALDGAGDLDLADVDAGSLQRRREQADELVLRGVGEREAHELRAGGKPVDLGVDLAERAVRDEDSSLFRLLQVGERLLDCGDEPYDGDVEDAPDGVGTRGQQVSRLG